MIGFVATVGLNVASIPWGDDLSADYSPALRTANAKRENCVSYTSYLLL